MKLPVSLILSLFVMGKAFLGAADIPAFEWESEQIDEIEIGYGLQLEDVDGDGDRDILLADKKTVQWYENPDWTRHVIAKDLTVRDNVCIAARDIDGDGKCEIAIGGQWNFLETRKDGAVHYLVAGDDRSQPWKPVKLYHEPSVHRMHWIRNEKDEYSLIVKPLRGIGSVDGIGPGIRILEYRKPDDPSLDWDFSVIDDSLHLSHNFHPVNWDSDAEEELIVAAKEGVWHFDRKEDDWRATQLTGTFAGEIRDGTLPDGRRFIATVEPMHGNTSAAYGDSADPRKLWPRLAMLDEAIKDGHAVAIADFLGLGSDQVVVGWRAMHPRDVPGEPGIKLFTPIAKDGSEWREEQLSGPEIAVEDIKAADLDGDGKPDIVAAARQTKNLVILWNRS